MINLSKVPSGHQLPFDIQTLEWISENHPGQLALPKKPGYMEIIWVKKASGTYMIDLEKRDLRENEVYCADIGQFRVLQADGKMQGYYLSFSPAFLNLSGNGPLYEARPYGKGSMAGIITADDELQHDLEEIMVKMMKEFSRSSLPDLEILKGLLALLMIYLARGMKERNEAMIFDRSHELFKKFLLLLEKNLTTKKMVCDYASDLGISPNHLNNIVKKMTGYPATYHIQQRKLLEAQRQVVWHGMTMKAVAYHLGFNDPAHFSKFFKTTAGMNFQHFKKGVQANYRW